VLLLLRVLLLLPVLPQALLLLPVLLLLLLLLQFPLLLPHLQEQGLLPCLAATAQMRLSFLQADPSCRHGSCCCCCCCVQAATASRA
jgi:hypothetical protein